MLPCLNKSLFGIECTGCGAQRATVYLISGEFSQAFFMYPAIYPIAILLLFLVFNLFFRFRNDFTIKIGLIIFSAAVMIISYIIKMYHIFNLTN